MARNREQSSVVRYDNKLNMIALKGMSQVENDVFFALLYKLKNKGTSEVRLEFSELKKLIGFEQNSEIISKTIVSVGEKIAKSIVKYETNESIKLFTLFQVLEIPKQGETYIRVKISEPFEYMINNLKDGYTAFEIAEFSSLGSKYSQTLYRLLKQFRNSGVCTVFEDDWEKFVEIMDIPPKMAMRDIERDILKPAVKELMTERTLFDQLRAPFAGLIYEKHRGKTKGRPIIGISFYFIPQTQNTAFNEQAKMGIELLEKSIKREHQIKQLKRATKKTHPITGKEIDGTEEYVGRYLSMENKQTGLWDMLKIVKIKRSGEGLGVTLTNVDDGFKSSMRFDSFEHFLNTFKKYGN